MEIKTINDLVCLVNSGSIEKILYKKTKGKDDKAFLITDFSSIHKNSFKNVSTIETLKISTKTNLTIEQSAFENCSKLKTVVLEMDSKKLLIESDAFKSCNELDCVHIKSAGKIIIEKDTFAQCYNLRVVIFESENVEIRENAFESSNDLCIITQSNDDVEKYCSKHNFEYKDFK